MESKEQTKIKKYLEKDGWIVVKTIQLSESGYPDLFAFRRGQTLFIEVKREKGGRLSEIQKYRIEMLIQQKFVVLVSSTALSILFAVIFTFITLFKSILNIPKYPKDIAIASIKVTAIDIIIIFFLFSIFSI